MLPLRASYKFDFSARKKWLSIESLATMTLKFGGVLLIWIPPIYFLEFYHEIKKLNSSETACPAVIGLIPWEDRWSALIGCNEENITDPSC